MTDVPVQREAPSRRKHYRVTAPILIELDGVERQAVDWSVGGFRLTRVEGDYHIGDELSVTVSVPFQGVFLSSRQKARVVRYAPGGELAGEFIELDDRTRELLSYFLRTLISGEMATIDGIIKRIDVPVTPVKSEIKDDWRGLPLRVRLRRILMGLFYLSAGLAVACYLTLTLYSHLFRVHIDTGVVTVPREEIAAPFSGMIERIVVPPGKECRQGEVLVVLRDQSLVDELDAADMEVKVAEALLAESSSKLAAHDERVEVYRQVAERQLSHFRHKVDGLKREVELARSDFERQGKLLKRKVVTEVAYEMAASNMTRLEKELDMAGQELSIAEYNMEALKKGFFFTGDDLEGNAAELRAAVETAERNVALSRERLARIMTKTSRLEIRAPFDGRVLEYGSPLGTMVPKGAPLIFLEAGVTPVIQAYLTQGEVSRVKLGGEAVAFIPPLDRRCAVRIIAIDRTDGYSDSDDYEYRWREVDERTALVKLEVRENDAAGMKSGMPALVNIERHHDHRLLRLIKKRVVAPLEKWARHGFNWLMTD